MAENTQLLDRLKSLHKMSHQRRLTVFITKCFSLSQKANANLTLAHVLIVLPSVIIFMKHLA